MPYKKFMASTATAALVVSAVAPTAMAANFTDVSTKYREAVDFVVSKGASGISKKEFGVYENIKRVDAAVLLANVLGLDVENAKPSGFKDVPKRAMKHVDALKEAGITSGKTSETFDSHSLITRGELAVWIQKGFELTSDKKVSFTDVPAKYQKAVSALVGNGITNGISKKEYGTYQNAKRGDYAIFLMRAFALTAKTEYKVEGVKSELFVKDDAATPNVNETTMTFVVKATDFKGKTTVVKNPAVTVKDKDGKTIAGKAKINASTGEVTITGTLEDVKKGPFTLIVKADDTTVLSASYKVTDNRQAPAYKVKSNAIELTSTDSSAFNNLFDGTVLDFGTTDVTVTDVDFVSDNKDLIADNDAVKEGTVAINTKYSGQTSIYVDTVTVTVNDTKETFVLKLDKLKVDVAVVGSDTINYQVESGDTLALEDILGDSLKNISGDITNINIKVPAGATVTWKTGAAHGSTPLIPEDSAVKTVTISGGGTFKATGDGVGPIRAANEGGKLVFKDVTIVDESQSYAENSWEFGYLEFGGDIEMINADVQNAIMISGDNASFTGCTFNSNKQNEYAVWVDNGTASFTGCEFTGSRGLKIHEAYGSDVTSVTVDNSTFGPLSLKPGVAIGTVDGTTAITIKNSTFKGTQPGDQSNYMYESDTAVNSFIFTEVNNTVLK